MRVSAGTPISYIVIEESASFYIARGCGNDDPVVLKKSDYFPVPEDTWRDVTAECAVKGGGVCVPREGRDWYVAQILRESQESYRFRKIEMTYQGREDLEEVREAFIIERRG